MYFRKGDLKMKKSNLSLCLVTSFIGALALSACSTAATSGPTASTESIVEGIEYNTDTGKFYVDIDKFYSEYGETDTGTKLFYDSVVESLVRYKYESLSGQNSSLKPYADLVREATRKVNVQHQTARDNAASNGTSEGEEWDKILESYKCETENDLKEHFLYELEKTEIDDWFLKDKLTTVKDQYIGLDSSWTTLPQGKDANEVIREYTSVFPYHITHVLVKLDADATDYTRASMTSAQAKKLWDVVRKLIDRTYTFEDVMVDSDDTSKDEYGDVGIMSTQTGFYNEFKLGVYAFDGLLSGVNHEAAEDEKDGETITYKANAEIYKAFGIDSNAIVNVETTQSGSTAHEHYQKVTDLVSETMVDEVETSMTGYSKDSQFTKFNNIPTVPWEVFKLIGDESTNLEKIGNTEVKASSAAYPRNVLFNQYLNFRSPFVITNEDITTLVDKTGNEVSVDSIDSGTTVAYKTKAGSYHDFSEPADADKPTTTRFWVANNNFYKPSDTFVPALKEDSDRKILGTGKGDVIIGVRSSAGIHFMVMRKSVFRETNLTAYESVVYNGDGSINPTGSVAKLNTTLQDYYTTETPKVGEEYPSQSYVKNVITSDSNYYTKRAETIKSKLKNSDSNDIYDAAYSYRLFDYLVGVVGANNIKFFDAATLEESKIYQNIQNTIKRLRENKYYTNEESILSSWEEYFQQLTNQNNMRKLRGQLPTTCAFKFIKANKTTDEAERKAYLKLFEEGGECYVK